MLPYTQRVIAAAAESTHGQAQEGDEQSGAGASEVR